MARALINVPKTAKRGQIIEIKTLISHVMETGFRRTETGAIIPRNILTEFIGSDLGEFGHELDALAFPARQGRAGLPESEVSEPHIGQQA